MKLDKLVGERFKDRPADCVVDSHALMVRGGYMKSVGNGIFSSFHILKRVTRKIEQIIREEMDAVDGQEVSFPVMMPASLWQESGRYDSVDHSLVRFNDRNKSPMVLGMTHEEAAVHLVREYGQTYTKYPFMIYQIQTKVRDEARPRAGLIRTREFTMKDAYSFHTSQEDMEAYYLRCYKAYERIFARVGLPETIAVLSDSGMMGGRVAHEFMLLTPVGEDSIVTCGGCDYRANMEAAESIVAADTPPEDALTRVHTPDAETMDEICAFLKRPLAHSCKAVVYQPESAPHKLVVVFIRGDLEVNETKVTNLLKDDIRPALITEASGLAAGYIGPYKMENVQALYDRSLQGARNLSCGANEHGYHYTGLSMDRDVNPAAYHDLAKAAEGGICPQCGGASLIISRGVEVGQIFQLETKYTGSMHMQYTDPQGELRHPIMGCYGIGIGRLAAAICEARHDAHGPVWPLAVAPWQVHLCCVRADDAAAKACADGLYAALRGRGIEVLYDDRAVSAGVMFADADLIGVPVRIVVSPRNMKENVCEIVTRDKKINQKTPLDDATQAVAGLLAAYGGPHAG